MSERIECDIFECGKPAVDFIEKDAPDGERVRLYLCAEHFDSLITISSF